MAILMEEALTKIMQGSSPAALAATLSLSAADLALLENLLNQQPSSQVTASMQKAFSVHTAEALHKDGMLLVERILLRKTKLVP
jgi:hypothetical protein